MYFQIYLDENNKIRWRLRAANHKTIANSGEWFHNEQDCVHSIGLVQQSYNAKIYRA